ncbi:MAG: hypothetical protein ACYS26_09845 [Planctomycetota bacterium]
MPLMHKPVTPFAPLSLPILALVLLLSSFSLGGNFLAAQSQELVFEQEFVPGEEDPCPLPVKCECKAWWKVDGGIPQVPPGSEEPIIGYITQSVVNTRTPGECYNYILFFCSGYRDVLKESYGQPHTYQLIEIIPVRKNGNVLVDSLAHRSGQSAGKWNIQISVRLHPYGSDVFNDIHEELTGGPNGGPKEPWAGGKIQVCDNEVHQTCITVNVKSFIGAGVHQQGGGLNPLACDMPEGGTILDCPIATEGLAPIGGGDGLREMDMVW